MSTQAEDKDTVVVYFKDLSMPLFRKQSQSAKKRLQYQQYLAKESPEKTFDISNCELVDIPSGTYALCNVLQKETLIAHTNWLSSLNGGGELKHLRSLRILDLHNNELTSLPNDIGQLTSLQVLNLEGNKLKQLPPSIHCLSALQTLNLRANKLRDIPNEMKDLKSLRTLDLSKNNITRLPKELCYIKTLENLVVDEHQMNYPGADVCSQGTSAIMEFLCSECGLQYEPPSKYLLDVLDGPSPASDTSKKLDHLEKLTEKVLQYELNKMTRQQELKLLEEQLREENRIQAQLAIHAAKSKKHLIDSVAQDQSRLHEELKSLQLQREQERKQLVNTLYDAEQSASRVVEQLLEMSERARKTEAILEQMEQERIQTEEWFKVYQEEMLNLRKKEVLKAMQEVLSSNDATNKMLQRYMQNREQINKSTQVIDNNADGLLKKLISMRQLEQQSFIEHLLKEEMLQKEAFEMLQLQKDSKHSRIMAQISMIEQELAEITAVEREQKRRQQLDQKNILEQKRQLLADLLMQLMMEKESREKELKKRMLEMEEQREANQVDYWLVQYQRLMDRKPQSLIDQETSLELLVVDILKAAKATDYIPTFARHRITIETMCSLTEDDLKQLGIHELGLRKAILREIELYKTQEASRAAAKQKQIEAADKDDWKAQPSPSGAAPAPLQPTAPVLPSSPPLELIARGVNTECVICMDRQSCILFLACGHVCSCQHCAEPLEICPMCRGKIVQRILLT